MRILMVSDCQTEFSNLAECEIVLQELLAAIRKYSPDLVVNAGDLKEQYNPVDANVVNFWVRATSQIVATGTRYIVLLGNHDRISQSSESKNWLSVMRAAGAEVVTSPKIKKVVTTHGVTARLAFLPYIAGQTALIEGATGLWKAIKGHSEEAILFFHCEVGGMSMGPRLSAGPTYEEMHFEAYTACFGGHIHEHQKIGPNAWFIGSPFCQDWGEVNQSKGLVLADISSGKCKVTQLRTKIPHWYDAVYLEEHNLQPEDGAYVRSRVPVSTKKISDTLRAEEKRITDLFGKNVRVHTIPQLIEDATQTVELTGDTDREKVEQYVAVTFPEGVRFRTDDAIAYLSGLLSKSGGDARGSALRFIRTHCENVLSFKELDVRYGRNGLVLLKGVNRDWPKQSNGSGKTNLLSIVALALFGETLKGQKNDQWASERNGDRAKVSMLLKDALGRKIEIERSRRPHGLLLRVDGVDQSTGLTGKGKTETQGLIEKVTGFDMRMLLNSVYIDQTVANGFLFGAQKARMDLIGKIQNLERFDAALEVVKDHIKKNASSLESAAQRITLLTEKLEGLREDLRDLSSERTTEWGEKLAALNAQIESSAKSHAALATSASFYEDLQREADNYTADIVTLKRDAKELAKAASVAENEVTRWTGLMEQGFCGECGKPTDTNDQRILRKAQAKAADAAKDEAAHALKLEAAENKLEKTRKKIQVYKDEVKSVEEALRNLRGQLTHVSEAAKEESERNAATESEIKTLKAAIKDTKNILSEAVEEEQAHSVYREMLEYAKKAFTRQGMPLYLSAALCPVLNRAAEEYSELFNHGNVKVRFAIVDGEFDVRVVNPAGSTTTEGQSVGESAMAGVIVAFALRDIAPKTNLLVLDEPGHGLDPEGARNFAQGLLQLKDRYETLIVTTHSPIIEAVLSGEPSWIVEKVKGVSRLIV